MRLLIEEYQYDVKYVADVLEGLFTLQDIDNKISVNYVGYYYNPKIKDCVFVLPKVLLDEPQKRDDNDRGYLFGKYKPESIINIERASMEDSERKFLYEFAVWIHRAIVVYNESKENNGIVLRKQIESEGTGAKKKSNTLLDVILALIRFNKENQSFFTFILKNIHSGHNKINWGKTISRTAAVVQQDEPIYLNPVNKKRMVNFDEELIVIFFSILKYIAGKYGFRTEIPFGFKLIEGSQFDRYINGFGARRLRQIKYKYFSDTAVKLWDLCYAFFDKTYQINMSTSESEYLLVKSFHIVFEAIIDELIGDDDVPAGLKEQEDGKLVDHFYTYQGLISNREENNDVYYIGDSKYYKIGSEPGKKSIAKQYTYARNVIQWNLNLFVDPTKEKWTKDQLETYRQDKGKYGNFQLRDDLTEGYNVIPNFFVSANINPVTLTYDDYTDEHKPQPPISRHFSNRLYDRDTLLLSHYDVNFLFVLSLYARNNAGAKASYKSVVRDKFRKSIQKMLEDHFKFHVIQARPDVNAEQYFKEHFKDIVGKVFNPYDNKEIFSLALDMNDPESQKLLDRLSEHFYVAECNLGDEPSSAIEKSRSKGDAAPGIPSSDGLFLTCLVRKCEEGEDMDEKTVRMYDLFLNGQAEEKTYVMLNMPTGKEGGINDVKYLLPIVDNSVAGYYEIAKIGFGSRTKTNKDGQKISGYPTLRILIGKYHTFGRAFTKGIVPRMANQIWTPEYLKKLIFAKSDPYANPEEDIAISVEEPASEYGYEEEYEWGYIDD